MGASQPPQLPSWLGFAFGSSAAAPPAESKTGLASKLKEAGLTVGFKPTMATILKVKPLLEQAAGAEAGCILSAWLGGANDRDDWRFAFSDASWTAQTACGVSKFQQALGFGYTSVDDALELLGDEAAAELVRSAGNATAKKSAEKQNENAKDDAKKLASDLANAVSPDGFGSAVSVGAGIAIGVVVLVVAYKLLK